MTARRSPWLLVCGVWVIGLAFTHVIPFELRMLTHLDETRELVHDLNASLGMKWYELILSPMNPPHYSAIFYSFMRWLTTPLPISDASPLLVAAQGVCRATDWVLWGALMWVGVSILRGQAWSRRAFTLLAGVLWILSILSTVPLQQGLSLIEMSIGAVAWVVPFNLLYKHPEVSAYFAAKRRSGGRTSY